MAPFAPSRHDKTIRLPLTVTSKRQANLRKELLAHLGIQPGQHVDVEVLPGGWLELHAEQATGSINGLIGLLAGRIARGASLDELNEAGSSGLAGLHASNLPASSLPTTNQLGSPKIPLCWCGPRCRTILSRPRQQPICWTRQS